MITAITIRPRLIRCTRCRLLRVPRPGKKLCAARDEELAALWADVTPVPPPEVAWEEVLR
jgi:hypothetical protein